MRRRRTAVALITVVAALALGACGGDTERVTPVAQATQSPEQLAAMLLTPADLEGAWTLGKGFAEWRTPGVIPEELRSMLPALEFCDKASAASVKAADNVSWQAFTHLNLTTPDAALDMGSVQELLLSADADAVEATFTALRAGMQACFGVQQTFEAGEAGSTQPLAVPAVGDDRIGERLIITEPTHRGVATWDIRQVLVRSGSVLQWVSVGEIVIGKTTTPVLTDAAVRSIVTTAADKLP